MSGLPPKEVEDELVDYDEDAAQTIEPAEKKGAAAAGKGKEVTRSVNKPFKWRGGGIELSRVESLTNSSTHSLIHVNCF